MSDPHNNTLIYPITIRNVRYPVGLGLIVNAAITAAVFFVCIILFGMLQISAYLAVNVVFAVFITSFVTPIIVLLTPIPSLVRRLELDDKGLHRSPGRYYDLYVLESITLLDDPHEDYADDDLPIRVASVRIQPKIGLHFTMVASLGDVDRLIVWANEIKITVRDQRTKRGSHES